MTARVDEIIGKIREIHRLYKEEGVGRRDVLICSHGESGPSLMAKHFLFLFLDPF